MVALHFLLKGFVIGFLIAAPVGPIGILCIRRSLSKGALSGFATGLGAATADACYGAIAALGLTLISSFLLEQKFWLQIVGIAFLIYLGISIFREKPATNPANATSTNLGADYGSAFVLTLTNPTTIASFIAVFAGIGIVASNNATTASTVVLGVFLGSAAWWLLLSGAVGLLRQKIRPIHLLWVNRIAGILILGFAAALTGFVVYG